MRKIRVAMIAPPWLPIPPEGYGGIENVLDALIPELMKLGVEVELFTTGDTTLQATKNHYLYDIGQYNEIHKPLYYSSPVAIAHAMFALNYIREDGGFDIIHDHNGFIGPFGLTNNDPDLPPALHTLHGPPFTTPDRLEMGMADNMPMWRQFAKARKFHLVGISNALMSNAPEEIASIIVPPVYNAVETDNFPFVENKDDYFITLARFHPEKGQALAVKLCLELGYSLRMAGLVGDMTSPKQVLLELANPLSRYRSLEDFRYYSDKIFPYLISTNIEYVGDIRGQYKLDFISKAKALLFPIQWDEPFGMAPIEALACGTPVVAMARGALPEIIEHGVNGFLANSEAEFKEYMTRVGEIDPAACRASVEKKFSAKTMAAQYLDRYQSIITKHAK